MLTLLHPKGWVSPSTSFGQQNNKLNPTQTSFAAPLAHSNSGDQFISHKNAAQLHFAGNTTGPSTGKLIGGSVVGGLLTSLLINSSIGISPLGSFIGGSIISGLLIRSLAGRNAVDETEKNTRNLYEAVLAGNLSEVQRLIATKKIDYRRTSSPGFNVYTVCAVSQHPNNVAIAKAIKAGGGILQLFKPNEVPPNFPKGSITDQGKGFYAPSDLARSFGTHAIAHYFLLEEQNEVNRLTRR